VRHARTVRHVADKYDVDLNDALFTRGYQISYYFTAVDNNSVETALPGWARTVGPLVGSTKNSDVSRRTTRD